MEAKKKLYIETYGCQMNFSDSEIVASIMTDHHYETIEAIKDADVIFLNTCSIRDNAEQRVKKRLQEIKSLKKKKTGLVIGILGCMAERLKEKLFEDENSLDLIVGPDAYRDLPRLLLSAQSGQQAANVILSLNETYADINPVRYASNGVSAFISIMRGCQNYCSYCVVPFTRGKERSRNPESIVQEAKQLVDNGYREVTLLGQNVNSYLWGEGNINFAGLIEKVAQVSPLLRVRFATSHPKDLSDELLHVIAKYPNICRSIHLPVQSGSDKMLQLMNRKYTRQWYLERIEAIRTIIPGCAVSTDIITGFCSESDEDHRQTLSLMETVGFAYAFMFKYSERPGTPAAETYPDDIPDDIKTQRLQQVIELQQKLSYQSNVKDLNKVHEVLIESVSKRSPDHLTGRNSQNKVVVFPKKHYKPGEYAHVLVKECTSATLLGEAVDSAKVTE